MSARDEMVKEITRRRVRELLAEKYSISKIAKMIGRSYPHTKLIVEQERPLVKIDDGATS